MYIATRVLRIKNGYTLSEVVGKGMVTDLCEVAYEIKKGDHSMYMEKSYSKAMTMFHNVCRVSQFESSTYNVSAEQKRSRGRRKKLRW